MDIAKLKRTYNEWKWAILLIFICIIGIPLTTGFGIQSVKWGNDFWPNAFSEFLGMFVDLLFGSIFTFVVIDKYLQFHKNKQWKKIETVVYKNLYFLLSGVLIKLNHALPKEMRVATYSVNEDSETLNDFLSKEDFNHFVDSLTRNIGALAENKVPDKLLNADGSISFTDEQIHASLLKFKQNTKSDITNLSSLIIPKLLNFSDDTLLLDDAIELEELLISVMSKIKGTHEKNHTNKIKYVWLLKMQEILKKIKSISDGIQQDINIE